MMTQSASNWLFLRTHVSLTTLCCHQCLVHQEQGNQNLDITGPTPCSLSTAVKLNQPAALSHNYGSRRSIGRTSFRPRTFPIPARSRPVTALPKTITRPSMTGAQTEKQLDCSITVLSNTRSALCIRVPMLLTQGSDDADQNKTIKTSQRCT